MMTSQIQQWLLKIDELTADFKERFADLPLEELNQKPNAQTWSIAENMQHLIAVNKSYFPIVEAVKAGKYKAPFIAKVGFFVRFMGNAILKSVEPSRRKRITTFPLWEPVAANVKSSVMQDFEQSQAALKQLISSSEHLLQQQTIISSPANRNIVYTLEKAYQIIVAHEERHLNQAIEAFETIYKNQYKYDL